MRDMIANIIVSKIFQVSKVFMPVKEM